MTTVGLPDSTVRESRDRVRAAIHNSGFQFPIERITVNLAPADLRKEGAAFDLPMAVGILCATEVVKPGRLDRALVVGELSLDASVRPVRGVLPVALHARREGFTPLLVPAANAAEASVVTGVDVILVGILHDAVERRAADRARSRRSRDGPAASGPRRARLHRRAGPRARKAGAGDRGGRSANVLMIGPPGTSKIMLARDRLDPAGVVT